MAAAARRDFNDLLTVISHQDSSDSYEDSSDEDDLDTLLLFSMFPDNHSDFTRKNYEDLTNFECEEMCRQVFLHFTESVMCYFRLTPCFFFLCKGFKKMTCTGF